MSTDKAFYHFTHTQLFFHNLYTFAQNVCWTFVLTLVLPVQVIKMVGRSNKATVNGIFLAILNLAHLTSAIIFGILSDRTGKRKIFVIVGAIGVSIFLNIMVWIPELQIELYFKLVLYGLFVFLSALCGMGAAGPFLASIPDKMNPEQFGVASGWNGALTLAGNLIGGLFAVLVDYTPIYPLQTYVCICAFLWVIGLNSVLVVWRNMDMDIPSENKPISIKDELKQLFKPFKNRNFRWVFGTRLFNTCGLSLMQFFVFFWLLDVYAPLSLFGYDIEVDMGEGLVTIVSSLSATFTALAGGILSDKLGRKAVVYMSVIVQASSMILMVWVQSNFLVVLIFVTFFGVGMGMYQAVDWALINDVLPSEKEAAKDLGIWQVALTLPFIVLNPVVGFLQDFLRRIGRDMGRPALGYEISFTLGAVIVIISGLLVHYVKLPPKHKITTVALEESTHFIAPEKSVNNYQN